MREAHDTFASTVRACLRAIPPTPDHEYYAAHRASTDPRLAGKVLCACWNPEDSVKHLREATRHRTEELLDECRTALSATLRNYAILFNGSLGHSYGDKDFAFHEDPSQALHSTSLALAAIDDIRRSNRYPFPIFARAAIGTGNSPSSTASPKALRQHRLPRDQPRGRPRPQQEQRRVTTPHHRAIPARTTTPHALRVGTNQPRDCNSVAHRLTTGLQALAGENRVEPVN